MKCRLATVTLTLLLAGTLIAIPGATARRAALTQLLPEKEGVTAPLSFTGPVFQDGMTYVSWPPNFDSADSNESLRLLSLTHTQWVAICVYWYQDNITSTQIYPSTNSPSNSSVIEAIERCHELGMKVMLKPMVDPLDGNWRGFIPPSAGWFASYTNFISFWAEFSQQYNVDMFCVGCEFSSNDGQTASWENVVAAVRQRYSGPITYAANWDDYQNVQWWNATDYVGIDAYFPLTNETDPTVDELMAGWTPWVQQMASWQATVNEPIIFTEIGYRSVAGTNEDPADSSTSGPVDLQEQVDCYNATFQTLSNLNWFYGYYWWNWETDPNAGGSTDTSYTPQNKPAQDLITSMYAGIHDVAITNVTSSKTVVGQGYGLNVSVTAANMGTYTETFNVSAYANTTVIGTQQVTDLSATGQTNLTFVWNTTGFAYGNYTLSAYAWPVPNETNTANNNLTAGTIYVGIPGDLNSDGVVDIYDAILLAAAFGSTPGSPNWNPNADINGDGVVDIYDALILASNFNQN